MQSSITVLLYKYTTTIICLFACLGPLGHVDFRQPGDSKTQKKGDAKGKEFIFIGVSNVFLRFPTRRFKMQEPAVYIQNEYLML